MKKIILFMAIGLLALSAVFAPALFAQKGTDGIIVYTQGLVRMKAPGQAWVTAKKETVVVPQSTLSTGRNAYCDIALDNTFENIISLGPNTEIIFGGSFRQAQVAKGRVFSLLEKMQGSSFEVKTPVAIAGARGTGWETVVGLKSIFNVFQNNIYVKALNKRGLATKEISLGEGKTVDVASGGRMGRVGNLSPKELARLKKWAANIRKRAKADEWKKIIQNYKGQKPNLFKDLMKLEAEKDPKLNKISSQGAGIAGGQDDDNNNNVPGNDITTQTYGNGTTGSSSGSGQEVGY